MIYRIRLPHGDQHEPLDEMLVLETGTDLRYTDIGERFFKSASYWPDNTNSREIMGQPMHREFTSEFHRCAKLVLTDPCLRWLTPTVARDTDKINALSRLSGLTISLLLSGLPGGTLDDVSSNVDRFFRIIRPDLRSVPIRLSLSLPWTSNVADCTLRSEGIIESMVKHIDPVAWGPEIDKIRVLVFNRWPGEIAPEMALYKTVGEHVLASAKAERTTEEKEYCAQWDWQTAAIVFQSNTRLLRWVSGGSGCCNIYNYISSPEHLEKSHMLSEME